MGEETDSDKACVHEETLAPPFSRVPLEESEGEGVRPFLENTDCKMFQVALENTTAAATEHTTAVKRPMIRITDLTSSDGGKKQSLNQST